MMNPAASNMPPNGPTMMPNQQFNPNQQPPQQQPQMQQPQHKYMQELIQQMHNGGGDSDSESDSDTSHQGQMQQQFQTQSVPNRNRFAAANSSDLNARLNPAPASASASASASTLSKEGFALANAVFQASNASDAENKDVLLQKLDHIISLLEDQQDEQTGHVTEELVLYCFLGVFIIFIVDSFARAGKYVRWSHASIDRN